MPTRSGDKRGLNMAGSKKNLVLDLMLNNADFKMQISAAAKEVGKLQKNITGTRSPVGALSSAFSGMRRGIGGVASAALSLKTAFVGAVAAFAVGKIIKSAQDAEKSVNTVATAMKRSGEFSKAALKDVTSFADGLTTLTGVSDEAVLEAFALAKAYGATNEQAKILTKAAIEFSVVNKKDLNTSIKEVSQTLRGKYSKDIKALVPEVANLTAEQARAAGAASLLLSKIGGTAAAQMQTFAGQVGLVQERFGNLLEPIGEIIIKNPVMVTSIKAVGDFLLKLTDIVQNNKGALSTLVSKGLKVFVDSLEVGLRGVSLLVKGLGFLVKACSLVAAGFYDIVAAITDFEPIKFMLKQITDGFAKLIEFISDTTDALLKVPGIGKALSAVGITDLESIRDTLKGMAISAKDYAEASTGAELSQKYTQAADTMRTLGDRTQGFFDSFAAGVDSVTDSVKDLAAQIAGIPDEKVLDMDTSGPVQGSLPPGADPNEWGHWNGGKFVGPPKPKGAEIGAGNKGMDWRQIGLDAGKALSQGLADGADGAKKFVSSMATLAVDAFAPGVGTALAPLFDLATQGKEVARAQIEAFVEALPEVIDAVIEAIPEIMEVLAENSGEIITALAASSPQIAVAMAKSMPLVARALMNEIVGGLSYQLGKLGGFFTNFQNNVHNAGAGFANAMKTIVPEKVKEGFGKIAEAIKSFFKPLGETLKSSIGTAMKVGADKFVEGIKNAPKKFAEELKKLLTQSVTGGFGGKGGGFGGLSPIDIVDPTGKPGRDIGKKTFDRVKDGNPFNLTSGGGGGGVGDLVETNALLTRLIKEMIKPTKVQTSVQLNNKTLADIILTLSRTNARLSA
jgi:hypothetical protein